MTMKQADKNGFQASLKSLDTEERIDICFYRHLGWMWACLARRLHITPNAITIASIFIGIAAGLCFYPADIATNTAGLLLLILANSFDSADGQLARMTGQYSRLGRILDGLAGNLWFITIYACICLRTIKTIPWFADRPWAVWILAICAGTCHSVQAAMADYYRQMHLQCVNGKSELETSKRLSTGLAHAHGIKRLTLKIYITYTRCQERYTPAASRLIDRLAALYPDGNIPAPLRHEFRRGSLPLMKFTNILTFNWRSICLACTLLCGAPWVYFAIELTAFNAILVYMVAQHERMCRTLLKR